MTPSTAMKSVKKPETDPELGLAAADESSDVGGSSRQTTKKESADDEEEIKELTLLERAAGGLAFVAVASSIGAIVAQPTSLIVVTGLLSGSLGPLTYYQQTELTDVRHVIESSKNLSREIDELQAKNLQLSTTTLELSNSVDRLEELEEAFAALSNTDGKSVKVFERQIHVNKSILKRSHINLKGKVLQNLLSVITSAKADHNLEHKIEKEEMDKLLESLHDISGLQVHDDRLQAMFCAKNFSDLLKVARNLISDDVPEDEIIFEIENE